MNLLQPFRKDSKCFWRGVPQRRDWKAGRNMKCAVTMLLWFQSWQARKKKKKNIIHTAYSLPCKIHIPYNIGAFSSHVVKCQEKDQKLGETKALLDKCWCTVDLSSLESKPDSTSPSFSRALKHFQKYPSSVPKNGAALLIGWSEHSGGDRVATSKPWECDRTCMSYVIIFIYIFFKNGIIIHIRYSIWNHQCPPQTVIKIMTRS